MTIKLYDDLLDRVVEAPVVCVTDGVAKIESEDGPAYVNMAMNAASLGMTVEETLNG